MTARNILFICIIWIQGLSMYGQSGFDVSQLVQSKLFVNKSLDISHFEFFFQDSIGRMWGGSYNNGMMMFNGESFVKKTPGIGTHGIHCCLPVTGTKFLVGTRAGLYELDIQTLELLPFDEFLEDEVTGLHLIDEQKVLVFCANRIVLLELPAKKVHVLDSWKGYRLIQHLLLPNDTFVLLTDTRGLFSFEAAHPRCEAVHIQNLSIEDNMLLCMLYEQGVLWLGSDKGLYRCDWPKRWAAAVDELENVSVKSLMKERKGMLWVGTNNGLYIGGGQSGHWMRYCHSTHNNNSLLNDCVWSIFEDAEGNKWLGVDGGVSFLPQKEYFFQVEWNDLIHTTGGNLIDEVLHDSHGNYWFGGTNGLGCYNAATGKSRFFAMQGKHRIPNNRVRTIYEDRHGIIWIGSDGGLSWFDEKKQQFEHCNVEDRESGRNALWTYGISEDKEGNIWLATCSGGLFAVRREDLLANPGKTIPALCNYHSYSSTHKIEYNSCLGIVADETGNLWVNADQWLYKIDNRNNGAIETPDCLTAIPNGNMVALCRDEKGMVWGALRDAFFYVNPSNQIEKIDVSDYVKEYGEIGSMALCGDYIWFLTNRSVGVIHKETHSIQYILDLSVAQYRGCYYDRQNRLVWIGGKDRCLALSPEECLNKDRQLDPASVISEIYINGEAASPLEELDGRPVLKEDAAWCSQLDLRSGENSIAFRISIGVIPRETERQSGYFFRMKGLDETWKVLSPYHSLIEYPYLNFGNYHLEIGKRIASSNEIEIVRTLGITIQSPWYYTVWFRLLVAAVVIGLFVAGIRYYRIRSKLHIVEMERKKTLALSKMKMEFLENISHELKTPLSLILVPVNKLLGTSKSVQSKTLLQTIRVNAMKLNTLVSQIVGFSDNPEIISSSVLSRLEVVEFVRSIISIHQETFDLKGLFLEFESTVESVYIEIDPMKLESVINNLLSNAAKFTEAGGRVKVSVGRKGTDVSAPLEICVADTGMGIPEHDLPHVFERFYQSERNQKANPDGSGIGLSMVKTYIMQHGGEIDVDSEVGKGTAFTITLPVLPAEKLETSPAAELDENRGLRILIVEDNIEIARFIADNLKGMQCTVVHNGKSGLETAIRLLPDIILADVMMPVMDGLEMSRLLRRNLATASIPIILLTAKDSKRTELDAYKLGVDAFLSKPFEIEHLMVRINQIIHNRAMLEKKAVQVKTEENSPGQTEVVESQDEKLLARITLLIEEHLEDSSLNVGKLAELSGLNEKQIYRKLKLLTGRTAVEYIKFIRLKKAAMLLGQKKFTVNEVMYMVGFSSSSYFAKCFADKYGKTPKAYMEDHV